MSKNTIIKNILRGIFTTITGLAFMGVSFVCVYKGVMSWTEALIPVCIGIGLVLAPDTIVKSILSRAKPPKDNTTDN